MEKAQLVVGFIRGTHGFSGECKVESASGEYEHLLDLKEVTLVHGDEHRETKVESVSLGHAVAYVKFAGIDSDEAVLKYRHWGIQVPRKYCKPLNKDEWYIEDLRGCSLVYEGKDAPATLIAPEGQLKGKAVAGTITDVMEGGGGNLLEVSLVESCDRKVLVPFNKEFIGKVDIKNKMVQLMHLWILE